MKLLSVALAACVFLGGCCVQSPQQNQLMLDVPPSLMEAPAEFVPIKKPVTPEVAPWPLLG